MTQTATSPQRKPLLDEASFQQLLSAAFVLQEHNDRLRAKGFQASFAENLTAIVETQKLIQTLQLDLAAAAELVAERIQKITGAAGTAIGILEKGQLLYRAATGIATIDAGTYVAPSAALSAGCLTRGTALNYPDVTPNLHVSADLFRQRGVKAFIAVPVYHSGQVAGVLELRFARTNSFRESDLRAAELMAGLLSEAMVTASRMKWKEALASERQSMLEALERIKPQIERLGSDTMSVEKLAPAKPVSFTAPVVAPQPEVPVARSAPTCSSCGSDFFDDSESFCGICGSARPMLPEVDASNEDSPAKPYEPWLTPYEQEKPSNGNSVIKPLKVESSESETLPASTSGIVLPELPAMGVVAANPNVIEMPPPVDEQLPAIATPADASTVENSQVPLLQTAEPPVAEALRIVPADPFPVEMVSADLAAPDTRIEPATWSSARKTQQWLETVKTTRGPRAEWLARQWQTRRANIYIVLAIVILLLVISGWGIRPAGTSAAGNSTPPANHQPQAQPKPELTMFESLMVSLGLAEPPPAPVYMGNPDTQVWIDVHTALYYCPGTELYGKTADGKFTSQRDAQQDQFQPANRKACP